MTFFINYKISFEYRPRKIFWRGVLLRLDTFSTHFYFKEFFNISLRVSLREKGFAEKSLSSPFRFALLSSARFSLQRLYLVHNLTRKRDFYKFLKYFIPLKFLSHLHFILLLYWFTIYFFVSPTLYQNAPFSLA